MPSSSKLRRVPPLQRLIVATDFSPGADVAPGRALERPLASRAAIHLVYVLPGGLERAIAGLARRGAARELERRTREAAAILTRRDLPGVTIEPVQLEGAVHEQVERLARTVRPDLVVAGRRGHRDPDRTELGASASRLLRVMSVPILLAAGTGRAPYRKPLAAVDRRDGSGRDPSLARREPRLRARAQDVRRADRAAPGDPVHARRDGDRADRDIHGGEPVIRLIRFFNVIAPCLGYRVNAEFVFQ